MHTTKQRCHVMCADAYTSCVMFVCICIYLCAIWDGYRHVQSRGGLSLAYFSTLFTPNESTPMLCVAVDDVASSVRDGECVEDRQSMQMIRHTKKF